MNKTALCVGINNYPGTGSDLCGCLNDAADWAAVATTFDMSVAKLTDHQATKAAILQALTDRITQMQKDDILLFTFSGHGTQVPDPSGDEPDGMDEALCAHDCFVDGLIYDDELWQLFRRKPVGAQIIMISDSCHSGSVARVIGAPIAVKDSQRRYIPHQLLPESAKQRTQPKADTPLLTTSPTNGANWLKARTSEKVPWPVLLLSGCQDHEYSYDAWIKGRANGAMTYYAVRTLNHTIKAKPNATYTDWFLALRKHLPSTDYPQTPRLVGSFLKRPILG